MISSFPFLERSRSVFVKRQHDTDYRAGLVLQTKLSENWPQQISVSIDLSS